MVTSQAYKLQFHKFNITNNYDFSMQLGVALCIKLLLDIINLVFEHLNWSASKVNINYN